MNEHIKEYCKKFIESQENPHYAVFLNGKWGTGKTYFINKLLEEYTDETDIKQNDIIKISLFGVKSSEDIDLKIYQKIHPVLSSNEMKVLSAVARTALKMGTNIDFNKDGKNDLSLTLGGLSFGKQKKIKKVQKKLIIIDDFERALMNPCEIFGYFSEIITESDTKVIFIGNEEKISDRDNEKKEEYLRIKEKTIGVEFELEPDKKAAIDSFISELSLGEKDFFSAKIFEISEILKCDNLRTIWQALYNLNIFVSLIEDILEDNDKEFIFEIFLILFIQKKLEEIHKDDDINSILTGYYKYHKSYKKYNEWLNEQQNQQNLSFFPPYLTYIPFLDAWNKLIFDGYYNKEWLNKKYDDEISIQKQRNESKEIPSLFKLINNWGSFSNVEFEPLVKKVFSEFEEGKYVHPGEILLFANYMILFSKWELIPDTVETIISVVNNLLKEKSDLIIPIKDWGMLEFGYGGHGYSTDIEELSLLRKQLKEFNAKNVTKHSKKEFITEITNISNNIDEFIKNIIHVNGTNKYYKQPVLSFIDIEEFYKQLQELDVSSREEIITALSERYGKTYGNEPFVEEYIPDYENLKHLRDMFKANIKSITYNPQMFFEKRIMKELDDLVLYFEEHMKQYGISLNIDEREKSEDD